MIKYTHYMVQAVEALVHPTEPRSTDLTNTFKKQNGWSGQECFV